MSYRHAHLTTILADLVLSSNFPVPSPHGWKLCGWTGGGQLVAGLLGVEAGQDAVIRRTLWNFADKIVAPYNFTVTNFTDKVSDWRNSLSHAFVDEGLVVPISEGANGQTTGNVLAGNNDSLAFARTAEQVFATVYGTGSASKPGGFFPQGADGVIAKHFLKS